MNPEIVRLHSLYSMNYPVATGRIRIEMQREKHLPEIFSVESFMNNQLSFVHCRPPISEKNSQKSNSLPTVSSEIDENETLIFKKLFSLLG